MTYKGQELEISDILIDTGSSKTILSADIVQCIQISPSPEDNLYLFRGVGGNEVVFSRKVDSLKMGEYTLRNFEVEIGGMETGFDINGILGMDYLLEGRAVINVEDLEIEFMKK